MKPHLNWWLMLILLLGAILRLTWLDQYPAGFTPDEAAFGYNAYSILKTGKDEWGTPWWQLPFTNLRSFGDYKLPLYVYLTIPSVKLFGLTEFSTRLPNALFGTLAIIAIYLLARQLFKNETLGILSAFILTISPWHIQLSRGAFEANLGTFLLPLGLYFLLSRRYVASVLIWIISFYAYHSTRLLTLPLILLAALIDKSLLKNKTFWLLLILGVLPGFLGMLLGPAAKRASDVAIFSPTGGWEAVARERFDARIAGLPDIVARFFYNKATYTVGQFISSYLPYLSPQFLITQGPAEATYGMMPGTGVLYLIESIFLGGFIALKIIKRDTLTVFIMLAILLSIIPAAIAKGPGYAANRAATMLPFLSIALAVGLNYLHTLSGKHKKLFIWSVAGIYVLSLLAFTEKYVYHSPKILGRSMLIGMQETVTRVNNLSINYSQVNVSRSLSEPHIYFAFYTSYDPTSYQQSSQSWLEFEHQGFRFLDQYDGYALGKYRFGNLDFGYQPGKHILYVGRPDEFPSHYPEHFHLDYPDGQVAIKVAEKLP